MAEPPLTSDGPAVRDDDLLLSDMRQKPGWAPANRSRSIHKSSGLGLKDVPDLLPKPWPPPHPADMAVHTRIYATQTNFNKYILGSAVKVINSAKFLGVHIIDNLTWTVNTSSLVERAQMCMYFLRRMRRGPAPTILTTFYRSTIESALTSCLTVWCEGCSTTEWKKVRRVVRTAERIIRAPLPSIKDISSKRCMSRARNIISDSSHSHHGLPSTLGPLSHLQVPLKAPTVALASAHATPSPGTGTADKDPVWE
ncbi:uncharacterized protein LOC119786273 [Cyprinodon tularosa]|uniref:uncharacterized protein LOC119786273 n=1 Tax=Cyprinodon tularosa TaxID=77115 RepID=UPI0018E1F752|nr:uncharacterized protein LOC119786273 [Cyprinodon tularosa]